MLPAYFANMAPVICKNIFNKLAFPLDFNKKLFGKPIFGKNKTFRGMISGLIFALIISFIQYRLYGNKIFQGISLLDYSNWLLIGLLLGSGALLGDIAKSFFKRRLNIEPGKSLIIFDQLDFVIGSLVFISFLIRLNLDFVIITLILSFMLNVLVNHISYYLKIRSESW